MSKDAELKIIQDLYDFILWMTSHIEKFPRHHRHALGTSIENRLQEILALLLRAKYSTQKKGMLQDANIELEILRFQLRLAMDLKILTVKSHGFATKQLLEIGAQAGAWMKSQ